MMLIVARTLPAKAAAAASPLLWLRRNQAGISAALRAPSVSSRLTTFVNWNASKKASAIAPVPSSAAIMESRTKPSRREASVPVDTVRKERIMGWLRTEPWLAPAGAGMIGREAALEHDPEKWKPVLRKGHAQTKRRDHDPIPSHRIMI
jgi:hypothetical protein